MKTNPFVIPFHYVPGSAKIFSLFVSNVFTHFYIHMGIKFLQRKGCVFKNRKPAERTMRNSAKTRLAKTTWILGSICKYLMTSNRILFGFSVDRWPLAALRKPCVEICIQGSNAHQCWSFWGYRIKAGRVLFLFLGFSAHQNSACFSALQPFAIVF